MRDINTVLLLALASFAAGLVACRQTPLDPYSQEALAGDYSLVSFTDKREDTHFPAGIPVSVSSNQRVSLTGGLDLHANRFSLFRTWKTYGPDTLLFELTEVVNGFYMIDDEVFRVLEDSTGRTDAIPMMVIVDGLVLEDFEFKFVFFREK